MINCSAGCVSAGPHGTAPRYQLSWYLELLSHFHRRCCRQSEAKTLFDGKPLGHLETPMSHGSAASLPACGICRLQHGSAASLPACGICWAGRNGAASAVHCLLRSIAPRIAPRSVAAKDVLICFRIILPTGTFSCGCEAIPTFTPCLVVKAN